MHLGSAEVVDVGVPVLVEALERIAYLHDRKLDPSQKAAAFLKAADVVRGMLAGGKALGVFLHAVRLADGSGYKVILEAAPPGMYSENVEEGVAAMSAVVERYVRHYPSQYMWSMKRFKKRPSGEKKWY